MSIRRIGGRRAVATITAAALALGLAACGGGGETSTSTSASGGSGTAPSKETKQVTVGVLPISAVSPVYLGVDKGFFADEGLKVKIVSAAGGAALVPSVVSGDIDFAYGNNVSLLIAAAKGLPLKIVSDGADAGRSKDDAKSTVVVTKDSPIRTPKDLEGKTIGVNTLNNVGDLTIKNSLEHKGVDVSKLKFLEVAFPDMLTALKAGRIDAAWLVSPFVQIAAKDGDRALSYPFYELKPGVTIASYFTSAKLVQEDPDLVKRFVRALGRSFDYINDHPAAYAATAKTFTKIPPAILKQIPPESYTTRIPRGELELTSRLMVKYGLIDEEPDLDQLIWEP